MHCMNLVIVHLGLIAQLVEMFLLTLYVQLHESDILLPMYVHILYMKYYCAHDGLYVYFLCRLTMHTKLTIYS